MADYPECEKMSEVHDRSQIIGEFLEWLQSGAADDTKFERPIFLAAHRIITEEWNSREGKYEELPEDEWEVSGTRVWSFSYTTEKLLAKFFGVDLNKVEKEKQAMLKELRK